LLASSGESFGLDADRGKYYDLISTNTDSLGVAAFYLHQVNYLHAPIDIIVFCAGSVPHDIVI
jgi:hypothetical protein